MILRSNTKDFSKSLIWLLGNLRENARQKNRDKKIKEKKNQGKI